MTRQSRCECGHSKKTHVMDFDNTRCCACWQSESADHTMMCECMEYKESEEENPTYEKWRKGA